MRYLPLTDSDRKVMLQKLGATSVDELFEFASGRPGKSDIIDLPKHKGEFEVEKYLSRMASNNISAGDVPFFIGCGSYKHHIPATVDHLIQRSEFLTAYTPYQPEISQGTLQMLFEFQTQIATIYGMDVANASMYDGSTACGEAMLMAHRITKREKVIISGGLHPHYRDVVKNLAKFDHDNLVILPPSMAKKEEFSNYIDDEASCVIVQIPDFYGSLTDISEIADIAHSKGALLIAVVPEIVSMGVVKTPGDMGADIVVGEGQSLGVGLNFGGPYVGLFATRQKYLRQMPGRLCGQTVDDRGNRGFVLTLSAREQHIRREKATSNICTNSGLCCLALSIHLSLLGGVGLKKLAQINHVKAAKLAKILTNIDGIEILNQSFFNEFTIRTPTNARQLVNNLADNGILGGVAASRLDQAIDENILIVATTEVNGDDDIVRYSEVLQKLVTG